MTDTTSTTDLEKAATADTQQDDPTTVSPTLDKQSNPAGNSIEQDKEAGETATVPSTSHTDDDHDTDLEKNAGSAAGVLENANDKYLVDWDGPDDPANPLNWTKGKKWSNMAIVSAITFITPVASSMFAPGVPGVMKDFKSDNTELAGFVVSIYILGFAIGPIVIAPLCELYGRLLLYLVCGVLFIIFTVCCAVSKNLGMLIAFRFLAGCAGAAPLTIGGGSISDLMLPAERGAAMAIFALGPLLGPVIGPVAGGYLSEAAGWRWIFWLLSILSGVVTIAAFVFLKETYAPVLLERKAKALRIESGDMCYRSKYASEKSPQHVFKQAIIRPLKMLFMSPIVFFLSLFMAIVYGIIYFLFTTFTFVFEDVYGFSSGSAGLTFIGLGIGCLGCVTCLGIWSDKLLVSLTKKNNGVVKPEYRLPPMVVTSLSIPIGLFWYGWSADKHTHWIVPILGTGFVGVGMIGVMLPVQSYLIDAFTRYAASALAAGTILRSLFGAVLPLAGQPMYAAMGLGWGNSFLGFLALAMAPIPWVFYKYGEEIRTRSTLELD